MPRFELSDIDLLLRCRPEVSHVVDPHQGLHMHTEVAHQRGSSMPHTIVAAQPPAIVMTRVWMHEHDWLHSVYASHANQSPTFRFPDLLRLHRAGPFQHRKSGPTPAVSRDRTRPRDPGKAPRRSCHVWRRQFDELLREHRAAWNSHPNPSSSSTRSRRAALRLCVRSTPRSAGPDPGAPQLCGPRRGMDADQRG